MLSNCVVVENSWESPGKQKDQVSHFKGNQPWIRFGRTDAKAKAPVCCLPDANSPLIGTILMLGKFEGRRRRGQQRVRWSDGISSSMGRNWDKLQEMERGREDWRAADHGLTKKSHMAWWLNNKSVIKGFKHITNCTKSYTLRSWNINICM